MNLFRFIVFVAIENSCDIAGNLVVCIVTSQTTTSINNANNQQFQTAHSELYVLALLFDGIFLSQVQE